MAHPELHLQALTLVVPAPQPWNSQVIYGAAERDGLFPSFLPLSSTTAPDRTYDLDFSPHGQLMRAGVTTKSTSQYAWVIIAIAPAG